MANFSAEYEEYCVVMLSALESLCSEQVIGQPCHFSAVVISASTAQESKTSICPWRLSMARFFRRCYAADHPYNGRGQQEDRNQSMLFRDDALF